MGDATINTLDFPATLEANEERIELTEDAIYSKMSEEEFSEALTRELHAIDKYEGEIRLKTRQGINKKYFEGDQVDRGSLREDQEGWVENDILRNIETFVPIATSRTPEMSSTPKYKNQATRKYALDVRRYLRNEWEVTQGMQQLVGRGIRNHLKNLVGVFQVGFDPDTKTFWTEEIQATEVRISKYGDKVIRYIKDRTLGDLIDSFPDKKNDILTHFGIKSDMEVTKKMRNSPVEYIEYWNNEVVGWRLGQDLVLGVEDNPHYSYEGQDFGQVDQETGEAVTNQVLFNHFKKPRHPFLFLHHINTTGHAYDDTTLLEQGIGPQNWINKRKRQIGANADSTNGHWVSSGDFISQEEFEKITGGIDEKIWLENGLPANGIMKLTGQELPDYIYNDLIDSRSALDNIMGTHATTRGEDSANNTLGQDVLQKQADFGRVDGYVRDTIEPFAQAWFEYMYQMLLVYGVDEEAVGVPEDDDMESENIVISRERIPLIELKNGEMIPVPLVIRVKQGSTLPEDEAVEYQKAQQEKDLLSPIDYLRKLGEANPRELVKNALIFKTDPFFFYQDDPDVQALRQQQMEAQAAQAEQAALANGATTEGDNNAPAVDERKPSDDGGATAQGTANALAAMMQESGVAQ